MNRTEVHPVEALLLVVWLALEAAVVLVVALVALVLTVARWRPAAPAPVATAPAAAPPQQHPITLLADALVALPQRELMAMAGTRRRLPKRHLVEQLVAACS
jgi:hypothetical protein